MSTDTEDDVALDLDTVFLVSVVKDMACTGFC